MVTSSCSSNQKASSSGGFTLVEILVAVSIATILLGILLSVIGQTSTIWRLSSEKIEAFQGARTAFDLLTRNLSQATLNTYLDYDSNTAPTRYLRKSELAFTCGPAGTNGFPGAANTGQAVFFQVPLGYSTNTNNAGLTDLLNTCGYYIDFTKNTDLPPHVSAASNPYRYRLMQILVPAENDKIYTSDSLPTGWFSDFSSQSTIAADNVILLILRPQDPGASSPDITDNYTYDSWKNATDTIPQPITANQLPPVIQVTMVAIAEISAKHLEKGSTEPSVITTALKDKFQITSDYQKNLDQLESYLSAHKIQYRVFTSLVPIRESKWSK